ncbi:uncharacterized protein B0P05DRAFT_559545 [Gilbertella persicaria]|uniref:uncharacterized protein n=1 Tax=Gilbertella persicaria TaxID=101096 RepID=UPI00221EBC1A|nr:uncharacterized protein B0P05DRAFT_559545 [Gilbertella persicaria]KAI8058710.1 hypothetical protein B0P05DRAFT_559545 [Gilbertella persicaria]
MEDYETTTTTDLQGLYNDIEHLIDVPFDQFTKDVEQKIPEETPQENYAFERPILIESDNDDIEEELWTPDQAHYAMSTCYRCNKPIPSLQSSSLQLVASELNVANICADCLNRKRTRSRSFTLDGNNVLTHSRASSFIEDVKHRNSLYQDYQDQTPDVKKRRAITVKYSVFIKNIHQQNQDPLIKQLIHSTIHQIQHMTLDNAYIECMELQTDLVPWIIKQTQKGPPDAWFGYVPPPREPKKFMGLFKRKSKQVDGNNLRAQQLQLGDELLSRTTPLLNRQYSNSQLSVSPDPIQPVSILKKKLQADTSSPENSFEDYGPEEIEDMYHEAPYNQQKPQDNDASMLPPRRRQSYRSLEQDHRPVSSRRKRYSYDYFDLPAHPVRPPSSRRVSPARTIFQT